MRQLFNGDPAIRLPGPSIPSVLLCATVFLPTESWAGDKRDRCHPPDMRYESVEHAVRALSHCYLRRSVRANREYAAGLISDGDAIVAVVSRGRYRRDQVQLKLKLRPGQSLVALWHVHGANGPERALFSPSDSGLVTRFQIPVYLTDPTGFIRRLDPYNIGQSKPQYNRATALRPPPGSFTGDIIGHINEELSGQRDGAPGSLYQLSSVAEYPTGQWEEDGNPYGYGE